VLIPSILVEIPLTIHSANLGPKTYLIFAGWMAACVVVTWAFLPETRGRTPAELDEMFGAELPAREFKHYVCQIAIDSRESAVEEKLKEEVIRIEVKA
jgi:hypothetical protein